MLEKLLSPETVAVVGASRKPGKVGHEVLANLLGGGFQGTIVPVNPSGEEILGLRTGRLAAGLRLPDRPVPDCRAAGRRAGRREGRPSTPKSGPSASSPPASRKWGRRGRSWKTASPSAAASGGIRLLGPNCLGLINTHRRLNASFAKQMPAEGSISVVSQSGALCTAILDWAAARCIGLAKLISIGNKADLDECDFVSALADDPHTGVIVAYLESIASGKEFVRAAAAAAAIKPVVVLKAGTSDAGARAASSHTGSLAGADIAYGAAFQRSGILRAATFEALFDYAIALAMQPLPKGDRVAIVTNAGGPGIMAADAVENCGMQVAAVESPRRRRCCSPSCRRRPAWPIRSTCSATPIRSATSTRSWPRRTTSRSMPSSFC